MGEKRLTGFFEDYLNSMNLVKQYLKPSICFAHYGIAGKPMQLLNTAKEQLKLWVQIIEENKDEIKIDKIIKILLEKDKIFKLFRYLDTDMQNRELEFSRDSILGIQNYIKANQ